MCWRSPLPKFWAAISAAVISRAARRSWCRKPVPALGFLALGCLASLAGAFYPAWLNRSASAGAGTQKRFRRAPAQPAGSPPTAFTAAARRSLAFGALSRRCRRWFDLPLAGYAAIALVLLDRHRERSAC
jgi:hypothetical protein